MKGDLLPDGDHVVRYVKPSMIREDGTVDGGDFRLRPSKPDETGLSVNWLEILEGERQQQLETIRMLSRLERKQRGRLAELRVGDMRSSIAELLVEFAVVHDPLESEGAFDADPSHAEINGLPAGDSDIAMLVGDVLAECVVAVHPALSGS